MGEEVGRSPFRGTAPRLTAYVSVRVSPAGGEHAARGRSQIVLETVNWKRGWVFRRRFGKEEHPWVGVGDPSHLTARRAW